MAEGKDWAAVTRFGTERNSLARMVMELAGARYVPEYAPPGPPRWVPVIFNTGGAIPVLLYVKVTPMGADGCAAEHLLEDDTVQVVTQAGGNGKVLVRVGERYV